MRGLAAHWEAGSPGAVLEPERYALVLAHAGRIEEARDVAGTPTPIRRDYAMDLHWSVRGLLGVAIDDPARVADAYRELSPYAHLLAGAGTAVLVIAPVAEILGDQATYRGENGLAGNTSRL